MFFFQYIYTFILQGCIHLIKSDNKDICFKRLLFEMNAVLLNVPFIKES